MKAIHPTIHTRFRRFLHIRYGVIFLLTFVLVLAVFLISQQGSVLLLSVWKGEWLFFWRFALSAFMDMYRLGPEIFGLFIIGALLFSLTLTLSVFYFKQRTDALFIGKQAGFNFFGIVGLFLGLQCFSCMTMLGLLSVSFFGAGFLSALPLGGREFAFLGVGLLLFSVVSLFIKATDDLVC